MAITPRADDYSQWYLDVVQAGEHRAPEHRAQDCEGAAIPSPAAIASAVEDALKPVGVKVCDLPLTPESVWRLANHNPETERRSF